MPSLIESIRQRAQKQTEFGYGIMTADRYVKNMQDVVGLDLCYQLASTRQMSFADALQKASKTLVYSNQDMIVLEKGTPSQARLDGIEVPKNTLMLFKHVLTSPRKDRDGDVLRTEGALVDPKMLLLWQHVHTLPIGKMLAVVEHNSKRLTLLSCIVDINELSHDAAVMVDNDMARFSHGFRALEFSELKETEGEVTSPGGFDIKKFEIMEESVVSVPSNADAEVQEVMLSLVEGGKLTSPMMKEYGKTLRQQQPLMVVSGITFEKGVDDETGNSKSDATDVDANSSSEEAKDATESEGDGNESASLSEGLEVNTTTADSHVTIEDKSITEKAGRVLSASNLKMLQDCYDDLAACVDTDKNMARGTQAICERCMGRLEKVIGAASMDSDADDKPKKDVTVKEAMALFLAESTESDRLKMLAVLQTMESIKASDMRVQQYKSFMGL